MLRNATTRIVDYGTSLKNQINELGVPAKSSVEPEDARTMMLVKRAQNGDFDEELILE